MKYGEIEREKCWIKLDETYHKTYHVHWTTT